MNSARRSILAALVTALALSSSAVAMTAPVNVTDEAALLLQRHGTVPVTQAGPYVARGTFRVQVAAKLGQPDAVLSDGTWLYHQRAVEGSDARGTLLVRFNGGRVSALTLATPTVVAALRAAPAKETQDRLANR